MNWIEPIDQFRPAFDPFFFVPTQSNVPIKLESKKSESSSPCDERTMRVSSTRAQPPLCVTVHGLTRLAPELLHVDKWQVGALAISP